MEKIGVKMSDWSRLFSCENIETPHLLPPLVLAYIGDAVYELSVRARIVSRGLTRTDKIHSEAVRYVCAEAQAGILRSIGDFLTEEEAALVRRGRNAKSSHVPKGASVISYRQSTGLECLVGHLFLKGNPGRLAEVMERVFSVVENRG
ncbi:MAG: Mini-ribonuclease 3 [Desulfocucumaceae bacterium]